MHRDDVQNLAVALLLISVSKPARFIRNVFYVYIEGLMLC
jgi:hypothetical protein